MFDNFSEVATAAGKPVLRDYMPYIQVVFNNVHVVKEFLIEGVNDEDLAGLGVDVKATSRRR